MKMSITTKKKICQEFFDKNGEKRLTSERALWYSKKCAIMERYAIIDYIYWCTWLFSYYRVWYFCSGRVLLNREVWLGRVHTLSLIHILNVWKQRSIVSSVNHTHCTKRQNSRWREVARWVSNQEKLRKPAGSKDYRQSLRKLSGQIRKHLWNRRRQLFQSLYCWERS